MTNPKPRQWWIGISDTNVAHIADEQRWASDYHMIEYSAYESALEEIKCLRSVLSEWDFPKECYTQWIRANEIADSRKSE